ARRLFRLPEAQVPSVLFKISSGLALRPRPTSYSMTFQGRAAYERAAGAACAAGLFSAPSWPCPCSYTAAMTCRCPNLRVGHRGVRATVQAQDPHAARATSNPILTDDVNKVLVAKQFNIKVLLPEWLDGLLAWSRSRSVVEPFGLPTSPATWCRHFTISDLIQRLVVKNGGAGKLQPATWWLASAPHLIVARPVGQKYNLRSELENQLRQPAVGWTAIASSAAWTLPTIWCRTMARTTPAPSRQQLHAGQAAGAAQREDRARCQLPADPDRSRVNETVASVPGDRSVCYPVSSHCRFNSVRADLRSRLFGGIQRHRQREQLPDSKSAPQPHQPLALHFATCAFRLANLVVETLGSAGLIIEPDQLEDLPGWAGKRSADEAQMKLGTAPWARRCSAPAAAAAPPASDHAGGKPQHPVRLCQRRGGPSSSSRSSRLLSRTMKKEMKLNCRRVRSVVDNNSTGCPMCCQRPRSPLTAPRRRHAELPDWPSRRHPRLEPAAAAVAARSVTRLGGQLDLAVLPVVYQRGSGGATEAGLLSADELVTDAWLADCIDGPAVMVAGRPDSEPWYGPACCPPQPQALAGVVLCVSGFEPARSEERVTHPGPRPRRHRPGQPQPRQQADRQLPGHHSPGAGGQRGPQILGRNGLGAACTASPSTGWASAAVRAAACAEAEFHIDSLADYEERKRREAAAAAASAMSRQCPRLRIPQRLTAVAMVTSTMAVRLRCSGQSGVPDAQQQQRQPANIRTGRPWTARAGYRPRFDLQALSAPPCAAPVPGRRPARAGLGSVQYARARRNIRQTCRRRGKYASCSSCCRRRPQRLPSRGSANSAVATAADANGDFATPQTSQQAAGLLSARHRLPVRPPRRPAVHRLAQLAESLGARSRWQWDPRTCTPTWLPRGRRLMIPSCSGRCSRSRPPLPRRLRPDWSARPGCCSASGCDAGLDTERDYPPTRASAASLQELSSKLDCFGKGADNSPDGVSGRRSRRPTFNDIGGASAWHTGGAVVTAAGQPAGPESSPPAALLESEPDESAVWRRWRQRQRLRRRAAGKAATVASSVAANAAAAATAAVRPNEPLLVGWRYTPTRTGARAAAAPASSASPRAPSPPRLFQITGFSAQDRDRLVSQIARPGGLAGLSEEFKAAATWSAPPAAQRETLSAAVAAGMGLPPAMPMLKPLPRRPAAELPEEHSSTSEWSRGGGGGERLRICGRREYPALLAPRCLQPATWHGEPFRDWRAALPAAPAGQAGQLPDASWRPAVGRVVADDGPPYPAAASVSHAFCQRGNYAGCSGHPVRRRGSHLSLLLRNRLHRPPTWWTRSARARARAGALTGCRSSAQATASGMLTRLWPAGGAGSSGAAGGGSGFTRAARIVLAPPDFQVNPSLLIDSYLEWPVRLLGSLSATGTSATGPTYLLSLVDSIERGIRGSRSPPVDAMLSLSVSGLRLERRVQPQQQQQPPQQMPEVLLRVPCPSAALCGLRQGLRQAPARALHYSPDANGTSQLCAMSVHARIHAQEICAVARQLLQLAYTEATLEFFDRALGGAASNIRRRPLRHPALRARRRRPQRSGSGWQRRQRQGRRRRSPHGNDSNATPRPVIGRRDNPQEAVSSLAGSLASAGHVRQLFRAWSSGASSFAGSVRPQLERLFPAERSHLLLGLRPFIPARADHQAFDEFLHDAALDRPVTVARTASSVRSRDSSEVDLDQALAPSLL
uniref:BRCT domain-containing protein n=1 Tax=Macrostomum lignano TaxID=282301 RepID=A0A1I8FHA8_9PLAT